MKLFVTLQLLPCCYIAVFIAVFISVTSVCDRREKTETEQGAAKRPLPQRGNRVSAGKSRAGKRSIVCVFAADNGLQHTTIAAHAATQSRMRHCIVSLHRAFLI